jgi:hypothetical protein
MHDCPGRKTKIKIKLTPGDFLSGRKELALSARLTSNQ